MPSPTNSPRVGLLLHEDLFVRSWVDTGYLSSLRAMLDLEVLVPDDSPLVSILLEQAGVEFSSIPLRRPLVLHVLGRLQWAASVRLNPTLNEKRKILLWGFLAWPRKVGLKVRIRTLVEMAKTFIRFCLRSPIGALIALVPPPSGLVKLVGKLTEALHLKVWELPHDHFEAFILPSAGFENWLGSAIVDLRRRKIRSILIPDNWDNLTSKNSVAVLPDYIVTLGQATGDNLHSALGIPRRVIKPIGLPKFSYVQKEGAAARGLPGLRVLFLGFSLPYLETKTLNDVYRHLKDRLGEGIELVYKPHPARAPRQAPEEVTAEGIVVIDSKSRYQLPELDENYASFLAAFDVVIAPPTTMVLEFMLMGRAEVVLDLTVDGVHVTSPGRVFKNWTHVRDLEPLQLMSGATPAEIVEAVVLSLNSGKSRKAINSVLCPSPWDYSKNLANLVLNEAN